MKYFVYGHDGGKYGPVDFPTLILWANEGRIDSNTQLEEVSSGKRQSVGSIPGIITPSSYSSTSRTSTSSSAGSSSTASQGVPPPYQAQPQQPQNPYSSPYHRGHQQAPYSQNPYTQHPFQRPPSSPHNSWLGSDDEEANGVLFQAWVLIGIAAAIIVIGLGPFFIEFIAVIAAAIGWKRANDAKQMGHPNTTIASLIALIVGGVALAQTIAWLFLIGLVFLWR